MKKFRFLLALVVVFSLISTFAFASDISIVLSDVEYTGENVTVTVALSESNADKLTITGEFCWDTDVWEYVSKTGSIYGADTDTSFEILVDDEALTDGKTIGTVTLKAKDGVDVTSSKAFSFGYLEDGDGNEISYTGGNVTVKKTDVIVEPETKTDVEGYTDVVNFASSATAAEGATTLSFDLYEGDAKHGETYSVNLADWGLTIESGTINFKVAIIGAPATGVTLRNPVVK